MFCIERNLLIFGVTLCLASLTHQSNDDAGCDITKQLESCRPGYCCARDEFLPELVYCKRIGREGQPCTTKPSESDCPCDAGLYCKPNVQSQFVSFYGRCSTQPTTDTITNTTDIQLSQNVTMDISSDKPSAMPELAG